MSKIVSLWQYSCNIYQRQGVQQACLYLQEHAGIDVPVLLFLCWYGRYYGEISSQALPAITELRQLWSEQSIKPLRQLRTAMKQAQVAGEQQQAWQTVRESVKRLELEAEKQLLFALEGAATTWSQQQVQPLAVLHNIYQHWPALFVDHRLMDATKTILMAVEPDIEPVQLTQAIEMLRV